MWTASILPVVKTLFFDLFNTLLSVGNVPQEVGRFTADILGLNREDWNTVCFGSGHDICSPTEHLEVIRSLAHSLDPSIPHDRIVEATRERQARFDYALLNIDTEVLETLTHIKARSIRTCLISNASTAEVAAWQNSPLSALFDEAIFSCDCGMQKPDVRIFRHALTLLDADPAESLFVGDGGSQEFLGACASGLTTVFTSQFSKPSHMQQVRAVQGSSINYSIKNLQGILDIIQ